MQGDWTACAPLKYLIVVRLMPDIKEVKCFIFTAQIVPPLLGEGKFFFALRANLASRWFNSIYNPVWKTHKRQPTLENFLPSVSRVWLAKIGRRMDTANYLRSKTIFKQSLSCNVSWNTLFLLDVESQILAQFLSHV